MQQLKHIIFQDLLNEPRNIILVGLQVYTPYTPPPWSMELEIRLRAYTQKEFTIAKYPNIAFQARGIVKMFLIGDMTNSNMSWTKGMFLNRVLFFKLE